MATPTKPGEMIEVPLEDCECLECTFDEEYPEDLEEQDPDGWYDRWRDEKL